MKRLFLIALLIPCMGARLFVRTNPDYLETDTATFMAGTFTVCAKFRSNDTSNRQVIFFNGDKDTSNDNWSLRLAGNLAGNPVEFRATAGGTAAIATTTTGYSSGVWHSTCARQVSTSNRSIFLDGSSRGDSTTTVSPPNADRTSIGRSGDSTPGNEFNGDIGHVPVWNVALTNSEIESWSAGLSPRRIRPDNLTSYRPINGSGASATTSFDIISGINMTITGTPAITEEPPNFHAPIVAP